jgi:hypothetical protein
MASYICLRKRIQLSPLHLSFIVVVAQQLRFRDSL